jgi:hypothetical protein
VKVTLSPAGRRALKRRPGRRLAVDAVVRSGATAWTMKLTLRG